MSVQSVTETMTNLIPVVFTTGVAWKMFDTMMPKSEPPRKQKRKRDVYRRDYSGGFSNVGF